MDIYEYAKKFNADYYDMHTGYIYHVQDYNKKISNGETPIGILVTLNGSPIGYARKTK